MKIMKILLVIALIGVFVADAAYCDFVPKQARDKRMPEGYGKQRPHPSYITDEFVNLIERFTTQRWPAQSFTVTVKTPTANIPQYGVDYQSKGKVLTVSSLEPNGAGITREYNTTTGVITVKNVVPGTSTIYYKNGRVVNIDPLGRRRVVATGAAGKTIYKNALIRMRTGVDAMVNGLDSGYYVVTSGERDNLAKTQEYLNKKIAEL